MCKSVRLKTLRFRTRIQYWRWRLAKGYLNQLSTIQQFLVNP